MRTGITLLALLFASAASVRAQTFSYTVDDSPLQGETIISVQPPNKNYTVTIVVDGLSQTKKDFPAVFDVPSRTRNVNVTVERTMPDGTPRKWASPAIPFKRNHMTKIVVTVAAEPRAPAAAPTAPAAKAPRTKIGSIPNYCPWDVRFEFFRGDAADAEKIIVPANSVADGNNLAAGTYRVLLYRLAKVNTDTSDPFLVDARLTGGPYLKPAVQGFAVEQDDWRFGEPNACDKTHEATPNFGINVRGQIVTQEQICPREFTFSRSGTMVRKVMVSPDDRKSATVSIPSGTYDVVRRDSCPMGVHRPRQTWEREFKISGNGWKLNGD